MCKFLSCGRLSLTVLGLIIMLLGSLTVLMLVWLHSSSEDTRRVVMDNDPRNSPGDVYQLKQTFHQTYTAGFWLFCIFGTVLTASGILGVCVGCSMSKVVNYLLFAFLALLIAAEVAAAAMVIIYRNFALERIMAYITLSFRYNLPDTQIIRTKFNCVDGTAPNFQQWIQQQQQQHLQMQMQQQPGRPTEQLQPLMDCRQVLERGMAMFSIATVCILVTLILIQFIVVYFSVQIGKRRGRALNDGANGRQTTIITSHPMNSG